MKYFFTVFLVIIVNYFAQSQLNSPESIIFDDASGKYYISNTGNGKILSLDGGGNYQTFAEGMAQPKGLTIYNNILYVTDVTSLKAFDLSDGSAELVVNIPNAVFVNDICSDGNGILYLSDMQANKIIKYDIANNLFTALTISGTVIAPNGLLFEKAQNRIIFVSYSTNSVIRQLDLTTMEATTLKTTDLYYVDGIAKDCQDNYYVSCWGADYVSGVVYKFNSDFSGTKLLVKDNLDGPADIYYNINNDTLAVPLMTASNIVYIDLENPPARPNLLLPEDKSNVEAQSIDFTWNKTPNTTSYLFNLSTDPDFNYIYISVEVNDTTYSVVDMPQNVTLYWRVRATNQNGNGNFSKVFSFNTKTAVDTLGTPVLKSPMNGAIFTQPYVNFVWYKAQNAQTYTIEFGITKDFSTSFKVADIIDTNYTVASPIAIDTVYYWRVIAVNNNLGTATSQPFSFTFIEAPAAPNLISPENNALDVPVNPTFKWGQVYKATSYELVVYHDTLIKEKIESADFSGSYTLKTKLNYVTYYKWYVQAFNKQVSGILPGERSFKTGNNVAVDENYKPQNEISIFPNPAYDKITVSCGANKLLSIEICDIMGQSVRKFADINLLQNENIDIDVSMLSAGMYLVKIDDGKEALIKKIMLVR